MTRRSAKHSARKGAVPAKMVKIGRGGLRASAAAREHLGGGAAAASTSSNANRAARDVDRYVAEVANATPIEIVEMERAGVPGTLIKDLSRRLAISTTRMFALIGVPKATAEKKAARGERVGGSGGQAAIGVVKLLAIAKEIVANSTAAEAKNFDTEAWLGQWIERSQPALGGRKPADLLDTPTGFEMVARLLGSIESGAYQ